MASVEAFLKEPTEELLEGFSRDQVICVAEHFDLDVGDKRMKENMKSIIRANRIDQGRLRLLVPCRVVWLYVMMQL